MSAQIPHRATTLTERREGEELPEPVLVDCPACKSEGVTEAEINNCGCGRWFRVIRPEEEL